MRTGEAIADRIKKSKWHYESCKDMNYMTFDEGRTKREEDRKLKDKLRSTFMNVRQSERRNKLGKLLFGEERVK